MRGLLPLTLVAVVGLTAPARAEDGSATATLLQKLLTFDTSNPPGDTGALARYLAGELRPLGAEVDVIETPKRPGPVHMIARLEGQGSGRPLLLAGHSDVVPVERERWTVDPFGGSSRTGSSSAAAPWTSRAASPSSPAPS